MDRDHIQKTCFYPFLPQIPFHQLEHFVFEYLLMEVSMHVFTNFIYPFLTIVLHFSYYRAQSDIYKINECK